MNEWLDNYEFYQLMQKYRFASVGDQKEVTKAFEAVKDCIRRSSRGENNVQHDSTSYNK